MLCRRGSTEDEESKSQLVYCDVKSTAVVQSTEMDTPPAKFLQLQCNTNLNHPPANWLRSSSKIESYLQGVAWGKERSEFSSFCMANQSPDLVGEVDVVSDAENIKKLLKIPYSKGPVSMMVHRVGKTLLLDDFDVHRHLLRNQQDDWQWLRKFYYETIIANMQKDQCFFKKNKRRHNLKNRDMFSKFLYYSIADSEEGGETSPMMENLGHVESLGGHGDYSTAGPMPEASDLYGSRTGQFQRQLLWNFEDIRMLIGTDLPIFGGGTHPCVSLKLRDASKPISILTGLDYWLDNLMCNVPELAMCYHLNGIVQSYELIKTEDIPNLDGSKFSASVVKDVATNILSFLKSNATKEGHTYWLFKGHNDDVVKLYDLTDLCSEIVEDRSQNPFTVPVGMLLYRVARNMRHTCGRKKSGVIRTLLQNCLQLLDEDEFPQVVTSANYLMSDLYVMDDMFDPTSGPSPKPDKNEEEEEEEEEDREQEQDGRQESATSVKVKALALPNSKSATQPVVRYPPITGTAEERCLVSLKCIAEGLKCLDTNAEKHKGGSTTHFSRSPSSSEAIPLHYEPLRKPSATGASPTTRSSKSAAGENIWQKMSVQQDKPLPPSSWHCLSKVLLLRKSAIAYYGLANIMFNQKQYGQALKYLQIALKAYATMKELLPSKAEENVQLLSAHLALAADILLMISHNSNSLHDYQREFTVFSATDKVILQSMENQLHDFENDWICCLSGKMEHDLSRSIRCYQMALDITAHKKMDKGYVNSLRKRFGNALNEQGVQLMNKAAKLMTDNEGSEPNGDIQQLWHKSYEAFTNGIRIFEQSSDRINQALLYSNCGRLMRLCAQAFTKFIPEDGRREFSAKERLYFNKALDNYHNAVRILKSGDNFHDVWESIRWELSSTYFTMATLLQDYAPLSSQPQEQIERDVIEMMNNALKYCETEISGARQPTCQYRAATIHHRLASLFHNSYRNQVKEQKKKHLRSLAELHYDKAKKFFTVVDSPCELLRVLLERVAMCEFQLLSQASSGTKIKTLSVALEHLLDCISPLSLVAKQLSDSSSVSGQDDFEGYREETEKLIVLVVSRLQFVLLHLIKNYSAPNKKSKNSEKEVIGKFKGMYATALAASSAGTSSLPEKCQNTLQMLITLEHLYRNCDVRGTTPV